MEQTPEGLALAAATRDAIKERKRALEHERAEPAPKKPSKRAARTVHPCQHEVAIPEGYSGPQLDPAIYGSIEQPMWDGEMSKSYEFQLDSFQAIAVACVERNESVLVAAHTSAGKTAVAEYAIAKSLKADQRVVYTSPLKALSNQKYRELSEEFTDVGLMTGDVTLNPNASCVVMTTEILRSMIYRGSQLLREVAWVIFDEVHYMKDRERGVVWEEVIIFMPKDARMVFLSATLPNSLEFAEWVASVHGAPCHVVSTDYRPTPLVHYAFPLGGVGLYLLVDDEGNFKPENFNRMKAVFGSQAATAEAIGQLEAQRNGTGAGGRALMKKNADDGKDKKKAGPPVDAELRKLIKLLKDKNMDPVIVFSFSRRECEQYASVLANPKKRTKTEAGGPALDFNSAEEKSAVAEIFDSAMQCLAEEDRNLPCIQSMRPMLQRGIGVHHSGLLPILKELVEILFQEQLIKCLFSTETFAMGLNMPAKTVIFTNLRKWDGVETRFIESGEYIQMSGRAGRRGKDDRGYAIMLADDTLSESVCLSMVKGTSAPLLSSFKLTYYTLLNLLRRVEGTGHDMEFVISRSFSQFQHEKQLPHLVAKVAALREEAGNVDSTQSADAVAELMKVQESATIARRTIMQAVLQPDRCVHFLRAGRVVRVGDGKKMDFGYGIVVSVMRCDSGGSAAAATAADKYIVDVLLCGKKTAGRLEPCSVESDAEGSEMMVVPVPLLMLTELGTLRIAIPPNLKEKSALESVRMTLRELLKRYPSGKIPELDPLEDIGIKDEAVVAAVAAEKAAKAKLEELAGGGEGYEGVKVTDKAAELRRKAQLLVEADTLERRMRDSQLTNFQEEAKNRLAVLKKLGHVNEDGVVGLKGRAASAIDTADELLTSELMFNGTFTSLDKHQLAALVSCLIQVENTNADIKLSIHLADALGQLQETARHIASTCSECKLKVEADEYVESFRASLINVIYEWSKGASFGSICAITDIMEGTIIRAIRRLDELMANLQVSAEVVGDVKLAALFKDSRETLRRDLPFAASLYI